MSVLLLISSLVAADVDAEPATKGPAPVILTASVKGDQLVSRFDRTRSVPVRTVQKVNKDGKEVLVEVETYQTFVETLEEVQDVTKATFSTAGGKRLTLDEARKRLGKRQHVIVSSDGRPVDASYLRLFDRDVLVIVAPRTQPKVDEPRSETLPVGPKKQ